MKAICQKLVLLIICLSITGCEPGIDSGPPTAKDSRPSVAVVNYPLEYFAKRIGGDLVEVAFPAPDDVDPAYWQPGSSELRIYQEADLILLNGAAYAGWTAKAPLAAARTHDTSTEFQDRLIESGHSFSHSHGPEGAHEHHALASHTWLDPSLARLHAAAVHRALARLLPDHTEILHARAEELDRELAALDHAFAALLSPDFPSVIASHPIYDYFARRYDLDLFSLHWEPDVMPSEEEWQKLASYRDSHPNAVMIWEGPPSSQIRARLEQIELRHAVMLTAANRPEQGDLMTVLRENLAQLRAVLP